MELERLGTTPEFARAPVMRRLLAYLVDETLAGRGAALKAYSVAVDGLGRADDFDAHSDSYPRVQVGRLRRMLDTFYSRDGESGLRIHIPPGRYRVEFDEPRAVPLERPDEAEPATEPQLLSAAEVPEATEGRRTHWRLWMATLAGLGMLMALVVAITLHFAKADGASPGPALSVAPILLLDRLRASPDADAIEVDADAILLDGLRRSWIVRVRADEGQSGDPVLYRLSGSIIDNGGPLLRLRLTREDSGALVWTAQRALPTDRALLREALAPLMAELIQPYGVIASDQRAHPRDRFAPGYRCFLEFDRYRRERTSGGFAELEQCTARTLAIDPRNAQGLAVSSFLVIDGQIYGFRPASPDAIADALTVARRAVAADPYSAFAHLALARAAVTNRNCDVSLRTIRRALTLNPNDADLVGVGGMIMSLCEDPDAERYLREALALDPDTPPAFLGALVILTLDQGRIGEAQRLMADMPVPTTDMNRGYVLLLRVVLAAFRGDRAETRAQWERLAASNPAIVADLQAGLGRWMPSERLQRIIVKTLEKNGIPIRSPEPAARR